MLQRLICIVYERVQPPSTVNSRLLVCKSGTFSSTPSRGWRGVARSILPSIEETNSTANIAGNDALSVSATPNVHFEPTALNGSSPAAAAAPDNAQKQWKTSSTLQRLKDCGLAGVVAYGMLNTAYYTSAFLFVWIYLAQAPKGLGMAGATRKFIEVFAMVWSGSQVTKLARAAIALFLAPGVDKGLEFATAKFKLSSKQQGFNVLLASCIAFALSIFGVVVLFWS